MSGQPATHPKSDQLVAFGLGQLDPAEAIEIAEHLDHCRECSETIVGLQDDTFVGLVRQSPPPDRSHVGSDDCTPPAKPSDLPEVPVDIASGATATGCEPVELPRELREHPRYEIAETIGRGGMGDVYKAQHKLMNRPVALKVIKPELVQNEAAVRRFHREVQAAARLHHGNIVAAYDAEQAGNLHFLVMEFVDGVDLDEVVRSRGALPVDLACDYIRQAAAGLQHAHTLGMVHRDIKPHNLMLQASPDASAPGVIKILDFGLASFVSELVADETLEASEASTSETSVPRHTLAQLTQLGTMMGTPDYIAPEQALDAHAADIRADIYSLGCTFYTLLTGRAPFSEGTVLDKVRAHSEQAPKRLAEFRDDVPEEVEPILLQMIAKNPEDRYQTPGAVAEALADRRSPATTAVPQAVRARVRRRTLVATGLLFVCALLAAAVFYIQTDHGVVRVEVADESLQVTLSGRTLSMKDGDTPLTIRAGEPKLVVRRGDFVFETESFQLRRGDEVALKVDLIGGEIVVQKDDRPFGAKPLQRVRRDSLVDPTKSSEIQLIGNLSGHTDEVRDLAFFAGGTLLASGSVDQTFRIWDVTTSKEIYRRQCPHWVSSLAISADGKLAALGFISSQPAGQIEVIDLQAKERRHLLSAGSMHALAFAPDGNRLLSSDYGGKASMWNVQTGEKLYEFEHNNERAIVPTFSPDGARFLTTSGKVPHVILHDAVDGQPIHEIKTPSNYPAILARFSSDGRQIGIVAGEEMLLYDTATVERRGTIALAGMGHPHAVHFLPGDRHVLVRSRGNVVGIFDIRGNKVAALKLASAVATKIAVSGDGTMLATAGGIARKHIQGPIAEAFSTIPYPYDIQLWRLPESVRSMPSPLVIGMNDEFGMLFEGRLVAPAELGRRLEEALKENPDRVVAIDLPKKPWTVAPHVDQLELIARIAGAKRTTRPAWSEIQIVFGARRPDQQTLDIKGPGYSASGVFETYLSNVREVVAKNPGLPILLDVAAGTDLSDAKITASFNEVRRVAEATGAEVRLAPRLPESAPPRRDDQSIKELHRFQSHTAPIERLTFIDDTQFVSAGLMGEEYVWDARQGPTTLVDPLGRPAIDRLELIPPLARVDIQRTLPAITTAFLRLTTLSLVG